MRVIVTDFTFQKFATKRNNFKVFKFFLRTYIPEIKITVENDFYRSKQQIYNNHSGIERVINMRTTINENQLILSFH